MGFKKSWDKVQIQSQLRSMASACTSPYNDGFISSSIKHELVEIKFLLNDLLEQCPTFVGEEEWYYERTLKKIKNED